MTAAQPQVVNFDSISPNPLDEGDTLTLFCAVSGDPTPGITFERDGVLIVANPPAVSITPGTASATLQIQSVESEDGGTYRCNASNVAGLAYREILVEVTLGKSVCKRRDNNLRVDGGELILTECLVTLSVCLFSPVSTEAIIGIASGAGGLVLVIALIAIIAVCAYVCASAFARTGKEAWAHKIQPNTCFTLLSNFQKGQALETGA